MEFIINARRARRSSGSEREREISCARLAIASGYKSCAKKWRERSKEQPRNVVKQGRDAEIRRDENSRAFPLYDELLPPRLSRLLHPLFEKTEKHSRFIACRRARVRGNVVIVTNGNNEACNSAACTCNYACAYSHLAFYSRAGLIKALPSARARDLPPSPPSLAPASSRHVYNYSTD